MRILTPPPRYLAVADDQDGMRREVAGHLRFGENGVIEFASGYNDGLLPRNIVAGFASKALAPSRGWLHVLATGKRSAPVTFAACNCGAQQRKLPPDLRLRLE